jgi:hypothetical protein
MPEIPKTVPFSEAQDCPECGQTGRVLHSNPIMGGTVHMIQCRNELCTWLNTNWVVETDGNGEVRVNEQAWKIAHGQRLVAPKDPTFDAAYEAIHAQLGRQLAEETGSGQ